MKSWPDDWLLCLSSNISVHWLTVDLPNMLNSLTNTRVDFQNCQFGPTQWSLIGLFFRASVSSMELAALCYSWSTILFYCSHHGYKKLLHTKAVNVLIISIGSEVFLLLSCMLTAFVLYASTIAGQSIKQGAKVFHEKFYYSKNRHLRPSKNNHKQQVVFEPRVAMICPAVRVTVFI